MCLKATCTSGGVLRPLLDIRETITSLGCQGVASSVAIMEQAYTNTAVDVSTYSDFCSHFFTQDNEAVTGQGRSQRCGNLRYKFHFALKMVE